MLSILTEQNVQASLALLKPTDVLISPDLGDYSTSDFDNLVQISPTGEVAARAMDDRLTQLSIPADAYAALQQRRQVAMLPDTRLIDEIRFEPMRAVNAETLRRTMDTRACKPVEQAVVDADQQGPADASSIFLVGG